MTKKREPQRQGYAFYPRETRTTPATVEGLNVRLSDFLQCEPERVKLFKTFLIVGESGSGKERIAKAIHLALEGKSPIRPAMPRAGKSPFLAVDCGALVGTLAESELFGHKSGAFTDAKEDKDGLFVQAGKGVIFLDEVDKMALATQAKFLRALTDRRCRPLGAKKLEDETDIECSVVVGTNANLKDLIKDGRFLPDLFYRINELTIRTKPLREYDHYEMYIAAMSALHEIVREEPDTHLFVESDVDEHLDRASEEWLFSSARRLKAEFRRCAGAVLRKKADSRGYQALLKAMVEQFLEQKNQDYDTWFERQAEGKPYQPYDIALSMYRVILLELRRRDKASLPRSLLSSLETADKELAQLFETWPIPSVTGLRMTFGAGAIDTLLEASRTYGWSGNYRDLVRVLKYVLWNNPSHREVLKRRRVRSHEASQITVKELNKVLSSLEATPIPGGASFLPEEVKTKAELWAFFNRCRRQLARRRHTLDGTWEKAAESMGVSKQSLMAWKNLPE